jgi:hypothetical protein
MSKLAALALVITLMCASFALAQTTPPPAAGTAPGKFSVIVDAPRSAPSAPTAGAASATGAKPAPTSNTVTLYQYRGPGGSIALDERPPSEFSAVKPGWTPEGYINVPRDAFPAIRQETQNYKTFPTAVYDGRVVYRDQQGSVTVIEGTTEYNYRGNRASVTKNYGTYSETTNYVRYGDADYLLLDRSADGTNAVYDINTGEIKYFDDDGALRTDVEGSGFDEGTLREQHVNDIDRASAEDLALVRSVFEREESLVTTREVFAFLGSFVWYAQQYAGMAGWSSLFFDDEFLANWRTSVNEFFCKTIILGGIDCWASKICGRYADITPSRGGVLFSSPVGGAPQAVAHIEGKKSQSIPHGSETLHVYTVTFGITNTLDKTMAYNVQFKGPARTANWWSESRPLNEGGTASALGGSALIKASRHQYGEVCLEFSPHIRSFDGGEIDRVCNSFVQHAGGASAPYGAEANETASQADTPQAPDAPGANV